MAEKLNHYPVLCTLRPDIIAIQYPTYQPNYKYVWFRNLARGDVSQLIESVPDNCTSAATIFGNAYCVFNQYSDPATTFSPNSTSPPSGNSGITDKLSLSAIIGIVIGAIILVA